MGLADYIGTYWAGAEILYGAIIAISFTSALREYPDVSVSVSQNVAVAALLCTIAWGLADGLFYLWERNYIVGQENRVIASSRSPARRDEAVALLGEQLDDSILRNLADGRRAELYAGLLSDLGVADKAAVTRGEAFEIVLGTLARSAAAGLVIVAPFFIIGDPARALLVSNLLGIVLLFAVGYSRAHERDVLSRAVGGAGTAMIGVVIAAITIALGG